MVRASKQNPLPNAPLELSDPITLPEGEVPGADILVELDPTHAALLFNVLRVTNAWAADGGVVLGWYDRSFLHSWEETVLTSEMDDHLKSAVAVLLGELVDPETGRRYGAACRSKEADLWLRRAARLALWYSDWETYAHALTSLGMLAYRQGSFPRSRSYLNRALRVAGRHGLRTLEGEIYHDRFTVAFVSGEQGAEDLAKAAYERYLPAHERLPALAYDIAYYWLTKGYAGRALDVLLSLLPHFSESHYRFQVYAASARAAGALGDHATFQSMWMNAMGLINSIRDRTALSSALLDFGYGAAHLSDWEHAQAAFLQAEEFARVAGHADNLMLAEACIDAVRQQKNPDSVRLARATGGKGDLSRRLVSHLTELIP